jgi:hypothetical protein
VCDYVQVNVVGRPGGDVAIIGTRLDGLISQPVKMRSRAKTRIWIDLHCRLILDEDESRFLTIESSYCGILFGPAHEHRLLSYDYERDKERYTEAHLQVCARHDAFEQYMRELGERRPLEKIHLPVGGRRFRPSVEDVVEALIAERLVDPKTGWEQVLHETRRVFRQTQIAALVRRNHGTAIQELTRLGYKVVRPTDDRLRAGINRLLRQRKPTDEEVPPPRSKQS